MPRAARHRLQAGFTLVELMIAVAVLVLLLAVALPSYQDSMRKSRRTEAYAALNTVQQAQERWRSNNPAYSALLTAAATATPPGLGLAAATPNNHYTISLENVGATGYTAVATAVSSSSQAKDGACARLRVRINSGNIFYGAATLTGSFDEAVSNRCWSR